MNYRRRLFEIVEVSKPSDVISRAFDVSILILIALNILAVIVGSFSNLPEIVIQFLWIFEIVSVVIFTIEYVLRVLTSCFLYPQASHPWIRYVFSVPALIDLLAILPFYLPFLFTFDLRFIRILRLIKLSRIFKLNKYSKSLRMIGMVLKREKDNLFATSFVSVLLILFASSLMYFIENEAQPDKFPNILASTWWAVATLTTVGYGDVYPITVLGKVLSGLIAMLGLGLVALPTAIISSAFIKQINSEKKKNVCVCPHCGKPISPDE